MANLLSQAYKNALLTANSAIAPDLTTASKIGVIISSVKIDDDVLKDASVQFVGDLNSTNCPSTASSDAWNVITGNVGYASWGDAGIRFINDTATPVTGTVTADGTTDGRAVFDMPDVTFSAPNVNPSNFQIQSILIVRVVTDETDSPIIARYDTATNLPLDDPNGTDVTVVWDEGAAKVFRI